MTFDPSSNPDLMAWRALSGVMVPAHVEHAIASLPEEHRPRARRLALALARGGAPPPPACPVPALLALQRELRIRLRRSAIPALRQWAEQEAVRESAGGGPP